MLFMVVAISAPQMYSDVARPAYANTALVERVQAQEQASQKDPVETPHSVRLSTAEERSNNIAVVLQCEIR